MSVRRILTVDNKVDLAVLKRVSKPVAVVDDGLRALMDDMLETMYAAPGIGLAAVQVDEPVRVIVMDLAREGEEKQPRCFVNPEITWRSDELFTYEEGCLSVPGMVGDMKRFEHVVCTGFDRHGKKIELDGTGLFARCLQHEMDHLDGILYIDTAQNIRPAVTDEERAEAEAALTR